MGSRITGRDGRVLNAEIEIISYSYMNAPSEHWRFTDDAGHEHAYSAAAGEDGSHYPTLTLIVDQWCYQEHSIYGGYDSEGHPAVSHYECRLCGEHVTPGTTGPGIKHIPGRVDYTIDGEPVTREQAETFIAEVQEWQAERKRPWTPWSPGRD